MQLKDASQLISVFTICHGRRQSTHSVGGHAEGVAGRPVPTPPAHGIKDTAAGALTELQQFTSQQTVLCNVDRSPFNILEVQCWGQNISKHWQIHTVER